MIGRLKYLAGPLNFLPYEVRVFLAFMIFWVSICIFWLFCFKAFKDFLSDTSIAIALPAGILGALGGSILIGERIRLHRLKSILPIDPQNVNFVISADIVENVPKTGAGQVKAIAQLTNFIGELHGQVTTTVSLAPEDYRQNLHNCIIIGGPSKNPAAKKILKEISHQTSLTIKIHDEITPDKDERYIEVGAHKFVHTEVESTKTEVTYAIAIFYSMHRNSSFPRSGDIGPPTTILLAGLTGIGTQEITNWITRDLRSKFGRQETRNRLYLIEIEVKERGALSRFLKSDWKLTEHSLAK